MDFKPNYLIEKAGITIPLIGFYDAPDPSAFEPTVKPKEGRRLPVYVLQELA
jgi:hypothetical protein